LREQAYLAKQVKITLQDLREKDNEKKYVFYFSSGLVSFLQFLLFDREVKSLQKQLFYVKDECQDMQIEIALAYTEDIESVEISFANNIKTPEGGMHLTGFRTALTRVLNDYLKEHSDKNKENISLTGDDVREGLVALISIKLHEPQFEGQTKAKLGNPDARVAVDQVMSKAFRDFLEKNPDDAKRILEKCMISARARNAAKTARDNVLRKSVFETATLPGKLADCISNKPSESELFIVEGESAGGSTKQARDRNIQAVLPLRGKILNVEKARLDKMMASEEIKAIILALGTAISENFNLNKLRYHKIILAADADCDGAHIRILLLTLFYRYFKPLVENGYIYIAQPPLYRIQKGKDIYYAYNDSQKEQILQKIIGLSDKKEIKDNKTTKGKIKLVVESEEEQQDHQEEHKNSEQELNMDNYKGISIQRYKGLGEMNPEQL
jgi:DNA gyrase subunit B